MAEFPSFAGASAAGRRPTGVDERATGTRRFSPAGRRLVGLACAGLIAACAGPAGSPGAASPAAGPPSAATPATEPAIDPRLTDRRTVPVSRVIDGDTVEVRIDGRGEPVRLIGINTPEVAGPDRSAQCFGAEASERAKRLLAGQTVTIARDPTQPERDDFDRRLAYVWLPDGQLVQEVLLREGYAGEYTFDRSRPYLLQARFRAAQQAARGGRRGLWAPDTCDGRFDRR